MSFMKKIEIVESQPNICINDIKKFEELIEAKLPSDYKEFLIKHNGGSGHEYAFPLIEPMYDDEEIGSDCGLGWLYSLNNKDKYSSLERSFKSDHGVIISDEFIVIASDNGGGYYICLGIRGPLYGNIYIRADDNYLYKIAESFSDFVNSLYKYYLEKSDVAGKYKNKEIYDKYSLPMSTHVKRYGNLVTNFFAEAPNTVEEYIIEYMEESEEINLQYFIKDEQKHYTKNLTSKDRTNNPSPDVLRNKFIKLLDVAEDLGKRSITMPIDIFRLARQFANLSGKINIFLETKNKLLPHPNHFVRGVFFNMISSMNKDDFENDYICEILLQGLNDKDSWVQYIAARSIQDQKVSNDDIIKKLKELACGLTGNEDVNCNNYDSNLKKQAAITLESVNVEL